MRRGALNLFRFSSLCLKPQLLRGFRQFQPKLITFRPSYSFSVDPSNHENVSRSSYQGPKFYMQQMLTGCLSIYSYYVESGNQAFIIDPQNDIAKYEEILSQRNKKLVGVFLTHYHADYIAGHNQLRAKYGCAIYMGPKAVEIKGFTILKDNQTVRVGDVELQLIHTPGHTQQSSCMLLIDGNKKPNVLFTGDTIFLGEVGRPDLAVKTNLTAQDLAQLLYDSIQKVKKIDGNVRIYPGHGAGSSCGKSIGAGDFCSIENQMTKNYAFKSKDKQSFVKQILNEMPTPPQYFGYDANINKFNPFSFDQKFKEVNKELSPQQMYAIMVKQNAIVIDVRGRPELYQEGMIKGSISIGFYGAFATWMGTLMDPHKKYIVYGTSEQVEDTLKRLLRIGYINIKGYGKFDIKEWKYRNLPHYIPQFIPVDTVQKDRDILDIRKPKQWAKDTLNYDKLVKFELSQIFKNVHELSPIKKYAIHCAGGYRAMIAYSFLKNNGYDVKPYPYSYDLIAEKTGLGKKTNQ